MTGDCRISQMAEEFHQWAQPHRHMARLSERLIKGSFLRVLYPFLNVIVSLFMMPFVIRCIGSRYYGLWILGATFVGYYELLDLGLATANERFISQAIGKNDHDEVKTIFNTCIGLYLILCIVTLCISAGLALATPYFVKNAADVRVFRIIILMIGSTMAFSLPASAFIGFLRAHILFDVINGFEIAKTAIRTGLILWLLGRGHGLITLAVISLGMEVVVMASQIAYVRIRFRELSVNFSWFRRNRIRTLFNYSLYSFIAKIAEAFQYQLDAFVITAFIGLAAVTHYNVGARLARYYLLFISSAIFLIMPVFSRYDGLKAYDEMREKFTFITKLNIILSLFVGGGLLIFGKAFIGRWMGAEYLDGFPVLAILTVGLIFSTMQITSKALLFSLFKHKAYSLTLLAEGICNLILSVILVRKHGIFGVALGTTIPMLVTNILVVPFYTYRVLELPLWKHLRIVLRTFLIGSAIMLGIWFAARQFLIYSYVRVLLLVAASAVVFFSISLFTILSKRERQYFRVPL